MLVLTRKLQQTFTIGDEITITLVAIQGDKVRIGIDAPDDLPIVRDNAYNRLPKQADRPKCKTCGRSTYKYTTRNRDDRCGS